MNHNSALTIGLRIGFADHAAESFGDVGDQHLIVQHGFILQDRIVLEHIEAVAEQAPQVERIERCGLLSAALKNCKGLSSGSLDPLQYNDEFERYNYSFSVLALRCTAIEPVTEEASIEQIDGMTVETIEEASSSSNSSGSY